VTAWIRIEIDDLQDPRKVLLWRTSVLPLAISQAAPLLGPCGIPGEIAARHQPLRSASLRLVGELDSDVLGAEVVDVDGTRQLGEPALSSITDHIQAWLAELSESYGRGSVMELAGWLMRNEIDWMVREENWTWWRWLSSAPLQKNEFGLSPASEREVAQLVVSALAVGSAAGYREQEALARKQLLTHTEELILRQWRDQDSSVAIVDVVESLRLARYREIGRSFSGLVRAAVTNDEWLRLVRVVDGMRTRGA